MAHLRRREFIGLLGGAAAWPLAARGQSEQMRRVGVLVGYPEHDLVAQARTTAFKRGLQDLGWTEGQNLRTDYRFAGVEPTRIEAEATDLVAVAPDVIFASQGQLALAVRKATDRIPIVFANVPDPVGIGLVRSLARPGGNVTGLTSLEPQLAGKWVEVLKETAPRIERVAVIYSPRNPAWPDRLRVIESVAPSLGVRVTAIPVRSEAEIWSSLAAFAGEPDAGMVVLPSIFMTAYRDTFIAAAARYRLPAVYAFRFSAADGGLVSYGIDTNDQYRRAASYVDRILRGEKPADLPVQAPTKFELTINLKTAKALGLDVPPTLLARADEVIE